MVAGLRHTHIHDGRNIQLGISYRTPTSGKADYSRSRGIDPYRRNVTPLRSNNEMFHRQRVQEQRELQIENRPHLQDTAVAVSMRPNVKTRFGALTTYDASVGDRRHSTIHLINNERAYQWDARDRSKLQENIGRPDVSSGPTAFSTRKRANNNTRERDIFDSDPIMSLTSQPIKRQRTSNNDPLLLANERYESSIPNHSLVSDATYPQPYAHGTHTGHKQVHKDSHSVHSMYYDNIVEDAQRSAPKSNTIERDRQRGASVNSSLLLPTQDTTQTPPLMEAHQHNRATLHSTAQHPVQTERATILPPRAEGTTLSLDCLKDNVQSPEQLRSTTLGSIYQHRQDRLSSTNTQHPILGPIRMDGDKVHNNAHFARLSRGTEMYHPSTVTQHQHQSHTRTGTGVSQSLSSTPVPSVPQKHPSSRQPTPVHEKINTTRSVKPTQNTLVQDAMVMAQPQPFLHQSQSLSENALPQTPLAHVLHNYNNISNHTDHSRLSVGNVLRLNGNRLHETQTTPLLNSIKTENVGVTAKPLPVTVSIHRNETMPVASSTATNRQRVGSRLAEQPVNTTGMVRIAPHVTETNH